MLFLNDYVRNNDNRNQNIGVQGAAKEFLNRPGNEEYEILCVCNTDAIIAKSNTMINRLIRATIMHSNHTAIELPSNLATHASLRGSNLSFCGK